MSRCHRPPPRSPGRCAVVAVVAILAAALAAGCGAGSAAAPDAGPPLGACVDGRPIHARFTVVGEPTGASRIGNQASGAYDDWPPPRRAATLLEAGGCRYVGPRPALCEPACAGDQLCDVDGRCVGYGATLAGGTLSITGTTPPLTLSPRPGNSYYAEMSYPGLYRPGDPIAIELAGGPGVPALHFDVLGVPSLVLPTDQLTAREHEDLVVAWAPVTIPGAVVEVHLDNDHHGILAYVECTAAAAAGQLVVPAAVLDRLILAGETGIGTYIENAWIEVRQRATAATDRGCAVADAYADSFLSVTTVRAP